MWWWDFELSLDSINKGELDRNAPLKIADLACGGGTLSYHLSSFFPNASFVLLDYNEDGLELAKEINTESLYRMEFIQGDLRDLPFEDSSFDLVFCWGVFLIFNEKDLQPIINEVHRILKPNGKLYASSLFNTEFDVDLVCDFKDLTKESGKAGIWGRYTTFSLPTMRNGKLYASSLFNTEFDVDLVCDFKDLTKESGKAGIWGRYTTFSLPTMRKILQSYSTFSIHPFEPQIDFPRTTLTKESGKAGIWGRYTTFSLPTMRKILQSYSTFSIHPFEPQIDFPRTTHRGIATYSVKVLQDSHLIEVDKNFGGAFVGETKSEENKMSAPRRALGDTLGFAQSVKSERERSDNSENYIWGGGYTQNLVSKYPQEC